MGFDTWLNKCKTIIRNEQPDWNTLKNRIPNDAVVAFMPAIVCDAWPIHVLTELGYGKKVMKSAPNVYIVPLGSHDYWIKPEIEELLSLFYHDENIEESPNYYEMSLEEVILLDCGNLHNSFCVDDYTGNGFVANLKTPSGKDIFILGLMDSAEIVWDTYIQEYAIQIHCMIDSYKGLGDWFTAVPLYESMLNTENRELMPEFYFKGKYIKSSVPRGFEWVSDVKESCSHECVSQIFKTGWR